MTFLVDTSRTSILSLYRSIIRVGRQFPTEAHRTLVLEKARVMFREPKTEEELPHSIRLAVTHLDDLEALLKGMNTLYDDDRKTQHEIHEEKEEKYKSTYAAKSRLDWDESDDE